MHILQQGDNPWLKEFTAIVKIGEKRIKILQASDIKTFRNRSLRYLLQSKSRYHHPKCSRCQWNQSSSTNPPGIRIPTKVKDPVVKLS